MKLINFTNLITKKKSYSGANGAKLSVILNNELYMLKLPTKANKNQNLSYANSSVSEYLGSHIFNLLGMKAQETILGSYTFKGKEKIAVCCKDFELNGYVFKDFASLKNQIIDSNSNGYGTELQDILETIEKQTIFDPIVLSNYFWKMFIIDALIGNWDRHNGNWGYLYNQDQDKAILAPIFDCGSCLYPQIDENMISSALKNKKEMDQRIFDFPTSAILQNGKRINYYLFIKSKKYEMCEKARKEISDLVNLNKINKLIDEIDFITPKHKLFLKTIIKRRYEEIIKNK